MKHEKAFDKWIKSLTPEQKIWITDDIEQSTVLGWNGCEEYLRNRLKQILEELQGEGPAAVRIIKAISMIEEI